MPVIRCTRKLLAQIGPEATRAAKADGAEESPLDWYANLLWIERRKCVLFTNAGTLYGFLAPDARKAEIRRLPELLRESFQRNLEFGGFDPETVRGALRRYQATALATTRSRRVLGSMNDYDHMLRHHIGSEGGLHRCHILSINQRVNEAPMSAIAYSSGNAAMRKSLL